MNAPAGQTQGATGNKSQESMLVEDGSDMKAEAAKAGVWVSDVLGASVGTRFVRVVALGALLVGAAALYSSMSQGEAGSQPARSAATQDFEVAELEAPVIGVPGYLSSESALPVEDEQREQVELIRDRIELIKDLGAMGIPWQMDDQGRVVFSVPPIASQ